MLSGWAQFLSFLFLVFLLLLGLRWVRQRLMWRLRNRLIVTYVFIGVIPVLLLVSMALLAGYLFAGQVRDLHRALRSADRTGAPAGGQ